MVVSVASAHVSALSLSLSLSLSPLVLYDKERIETTCHNSVNVGGQGMGQ